MAELTPEEKHKIYLEEKERFGVQKRLKEEARSKPPIGYYVALVGAALLILGLFLPWAQLGIVTATAFQKTPDSIYLVASGAITALLCIVGISTKKNYGLFIVILNFISGGLLAYLHFLLQENLSGIQVFGASAQIGTGFWMCIIGVIVGLIGGGMMAEKKKKVANIKQ